MHPWHPYILQIRLNDLGIQLAQELYGFICLNQLLIQQLVFLLKLLNQAHLRILVFNGLVRYVAGLARILEGIDVFFNV